MRYFLFIILFASSYCSFAQKELVEDFIGQALAIEAPKNFKYYYLLGKSIEYQSIQNEIENFEKNELFWKDNNFPFQILSLKNTPTVEWTNYTFKNTYVFPKEYRKTVPPASKYVSYLRNPNTSKIDSINNDDLHTLYLRKGFLWSKNRLWEEIKTAWKNDEKVNPEKNIYFSVSHPFFSNDNKYALLTISKMRRCTGSVSTSLYENTNGRWQKLYEFGGKRTKVFATHIRCGEIVVWGKPKIY